ncbi:hypothetical protein ACFY3N_09725 [Streptomyces sp. NPDC000348]|uniref:hypothetical protein n=1 Tax=Streptomyces sp. NPDC000348 TaxID=3364538 RepID=UPI0036C1648F
MSWRTAGPPAVRLETKRQLAPGHDAKLKLFLIKAGAAGELVTRVAEDGHRTSGEAASLTAKFPFGYTVKAGITRARNKAARVEQRKTKKAAPKQVTAKVGRWKRTGIVEGNTFTYTDAKGAVKTATKFTVIG